MSVYSRDIGYSNYGLKHHVRSNYGVRHLPIDLENAMRDYIRVSRTSMFLTAPNPNPTCNLPDMRRSLT